MVLKAKAPMQAIQALSMSNVNTRRVREATEHLARQIVVIESISDAKNVCGEEGSAWKSKAWPMACVIRYTYVTFPATGH